MTNVQDLESLLNTNRIFTTEVFAEDNGAEIKYVGEVYGLKVCNDGIKGKARITCYKKVETPRFQTTVTKRFLGIPVRKTVEEVLPDVHYEKIWSIDTGMFRKYAVRNGETFSTENSQLFYQPAIMHRGFKHSNIIVYEELLDGLFKPTTKLKEVYDQIWRYQPVVQQSVQPSTFAPQTTGQAVPVATP